MKTTHNRKGCRCPEGVDERFCLGEWDWDYDFSEIHREVGEQILLGNEYRCPDCGRCDIGDRPMKLKYTWFYDLIIKAFRKFLNNYINNIVRNIYTSAIHFTRKNNQTIGIENDYYITLEQLEALLNEWK
jgi:hypothetical protein